VRIIVKGKNIEVTPALRNYAEKKVTKLGKFFDGNRDVLVEVTMRIERELEVVEITSQVDSLILRGEEHTEDMYASIDGAVDKIERQLKKYKTKLQRRFQDAPKISELAAGEGAEEDKEKQDENDTVIVKTKRFAVKPMSVEEAVMQMDLLGHDFFVFSNADTEEVNVVYRRKDGRYGLIEPEFE